VPFAACEIARPLRRSERREQRALEHKRAQLVDRELPRACRTGRARARLRFMCVSLCVRACVRARMYGCVGIRTKQKEQPAAQAIQASRHAPRRDGSTGSTVVPQYPYPHSHALAQTRRHTPTHRRAHAGTDRPYPSSRRTRRPSHRSGRPCPSSLPGGIMAGSHIYCEDG
jgi:hypothetical protein